MANNIENVIRRRRVEELIENGPFKSDNKISVIVLETHTTYWELVKQFMKELNIIHLILNMIMDLTNNPV
jgi:predicted glycosyltransferase involved in capsule biosynthesis